jgi:hypothetical protein
MSCCAPWTCGICICNPSLAAVGVCAATANPGSPVSGGSVGTASCGMSQVTIGGTKVNSNVVLWILGGVTALYMLRRYGKL